MGRVELDCLEGLARRCYLGGRLWLSEDFIAIPRCYAGMDQKAALAADIALARSDHWEVLRVAHTGQIDVAAAIDREGASFVVTAAADQAAIAHRLAIGAQIGDEEIAAAAVVALAQVGRVDREIVFGAGAARQIDIAAAVDQHIGHLIVARCSQIGAEGQLL